MRLTSGLRATGNIVQETPQDFFDFLNGIFRFDLDVCALPENAKCERFYTPEDDGLLQPWDGGVWCNPPYGKEIGKWVEKASRERERATALSSCSFRPVRIQGGFSSMCTLTHGYGLLMAA